MRSGKKIMALASAMFLALVLTGCTINFGGKAKTASANDGGVWKSVDSGATWKQVAAVPAVGGKTASIANMDIRRMAFDPQDSQTIYLSMEKNGLVYTYNGGETWQPFAQLATGKFRAAAVDPQDKCNLYALYDNRLIKSVDCGRSWQNPYYHQNSQVALVDLAINYQNPAIIYVATSEGQILKTANRGQTWAAVYTLKGGSFADLILDPKNPNIIYAATTRRGIYKTADGGKTWVSLGKGLEAYAGSGDYLSLAVDPKNSANLLLTAKSGLLQSRDSGETWQLINLIPGPQSAVIYSAAVNPQNNQEIYYTTRTSLVKTTDGGKTWSSERLPFSRVANRILIDPTDPKIIYFSALAVKN